MTKYVFYFIFKQNNQSTLSSGCPRRLHDRRDRVLRRRAFLETCRRKHHRSLRVWDLSTGEHDVRRKLRTLLELVQVDRVLQRLQRNTTIELADYDQLDRQCRQENETVSSDQRVPACTH